MADRVQVTPFTPFRDLPEYLTTRQAADHTQQSKWTINEAVKRKIIPSVRFGRKILLIPKEHFRPPAADATVDANAPPPRQPASSPEPPVTRARRGFGHKVRDQKVRQLAKQILDEVLTRADQPELEEVKR